MESKMLKLLEEKIEKMISLVQELRQERNDLKERLKESDLNLLKLKEELEVFRSAESGVPAVPDLRELIDMVQEERTMVRDSIRGALRLMKE